MQFYAFENKVLFSFNHTRHLIIYSGMQLFEYLYSFILSTT